MNQIVQMKSRRVYHQDKAAGSHLATIFLWWEIRHKNDAFLQGDRSNSGIRANQLIRGCGGSGGKDRDGGVEPLVLDECYGNESFSFLAY